MFLLARFTASLKVSTRSCFYSTPGSSRLIQSPLTDNFNRHHNYLRISLTERCNLRCTYCMPEKGVPLTPGENLLTTDEILKLARLFVDQGVNKIRLTGGEPTIRPDIMEVVQGLGELKAHGLESIGMTSNGVALRRKLPALIDAGLDALNLSLDALTPRLFEAMTRRKGYEHVLASLEEALRLQMPTVKINCVVMRGWNEDQVLDFVAYTKDKPITVRFIEYMPFDGNRWHSEKLVSFKELLHRIEGNFGRLDKIHDSANDTTKTYQVPGYRGKVGFITSMTHHFCDSCNRLRITADGSIKVCLFGNAEVSLRDLMRRGTADEDLMRIIGGAVKKKKQQHAGTLLHASSPPFGPPTTGETSVSRRYYSSMPGGPRDEPRLTHTDPKTGEARMVSVVDKPSTQRTARAMGRIVLCETAYMLLKRNELHTAKGNVLVVAQIAGIQAAKATGQLIPLCHPLLLGHIDVRLWLDDAKHSVECSSIVRTTGSTGVEMEALTATSVALLTVYDMCKAASHDMTLEGIRLVEKKGGQRGEWTSCKH